MTTTVNQVIIIVKSKGYESVTISRTLGICGMHRIYALWLASECPDVKNYI